MTKRMLIDAAHPEETRVVVMNNNRLEEFDFEAASKKQLKGNIYLAKVTRVEPSLQAAFVEYGGNRHGFLAFSEIHPDYYRIPISDREQLMASADAGRNGTAAERDHDVAFDRGDTAPPTHAARPDTGAETDEAAEDVSDHPDVMASDEGLPNALAIAADWSGDATADSGGDRSGDSSSDQTGELSAGAGSVETAEQDETVRQQLDTIGGDEANGDDADDEAEQRRRRQAFARRYKIQEVIKRRQILLVQVAKEERGNKGAALTTYLSLAGRYCVLMPNTDRGGGVSRKITSATDRKRLKTILEDLEIPEGMTVIVRTAGSERSKAEIKRDYEYLMRLWEDIRQTTLQATAPALIHEEANIIKRSIRDLYTRDIDEVMVEGDEGYKVAKSFMKMLMPSHARRVQPYKDVVPLLHKHQVETQLDTIHNPNVTLRSGGYLVINQTEALVAIDVNSGRATRERHIEETALKTNLEAADEVARQLRLRDLAGLIVIDFIDMEEHRHQAQVERRLKEALKNDRARIQVGRISPFGLLEMSRQRLRPSLFETVTQVCQHCKGTGRIRSIESTALFTLRVIEDEGIKGKTAEFVIHVGTQVALYILNQKRDHLRAIEERYGLRVLVFGDDLLTPPEFRIDRLRTRTAADIPRPLVIAQDHEPDDAVEDEVEEAEDVEIEAVEANSEEPRRRKRRRGRRNRKGESDAPTVSTTALPQSDSDEDGGEEEGDDTGEAPAETEVAAETGDDTPRKRRRRGKRGGRRRSRRTGEDGQVLDAQQQSVVDAESGDDEAAGAEDGSGTVDSISQHDDADAAVADRSPDASESEPSDQPDQGAMAAAAIDAAPESIEAPPKPKRAPSRRRKPVSDTANAEVAAGPAADATDGKPTRRRTPRRKPTEAKAEVPADIPSSPGGPTATANGSEATGEPHAAATEPLQERAESSPISGADSADAPPPEDNGPKRRGWWQRLIDN